MLCREIDNLFALEIENWIPEYHERIGAPFDGGSKHGLDVLLILDVQVAQVKFVSARREYRLAQRL